jgi:hypothetical protein
LPKWDGGYEYYYARSLYPLAGRRVVPLLGADDAAHPENLRQADVVMAFRGAPQLDGFAVVWRGANGSLLRRTP